MSAAPRKAKKLKPKTATVSPVAGAIREFQESARSCPVHKHCSPLKYCQHRDGDGQ